MLATDLRFHVEHGAARQPPPHIHRSSWTCCTPNTSSGTRSLRSWLLAAASRSALPAAWSSSSLGIPADAGSLL
eukprot:3474132-Prymnesium_polylepis.1